MGLFMALGFVLVGAALTGVFLTFWDEIREWLNTTAADYVQRYLGYDARKSLQRAVCVVDRVVSKIRNRSVVYFKKNRLDTFYDKFELESQAPVTEVDREVVEEIQAKKRMVQEMEYRA